MCDKNATSWIEVGGNMVSQDLLDQLLGWLLVMFRELGKSLVCGCKDSIVCSGTVQSFDEVWIFVDEPAR